MLVERRLTLLLTTNPTVTTNPSEKNLTTNFLATNPAEKTFTTNFLATNPIPTTNLTAATNPNPTTNPRHHRPGIVAGRVLQRLVVFERMRRL